MRHLFNEKFVSLIETNRLKSNADQIIELPPSSSFYASHTVSLDLIVFCFLLQSFH